MAHTTRVKKAKTDVPVAYTSGTEWLVDAMQAVDGARTTDIGTGRVSTGTKSVQTDRHRAYARRETVSGAHPRMVSTIRELVDVGTVEIETHAADSSCATLSDVRGVHGIRGEKATNRNRLVKGGVSRPEATRRLPSAG